MKEESDVKIEHITSALKELEYGSIVITVHNGDITQIDTTEKKRFPLMTKSYRK